MLTLDKAADSVVAAINNSYLHLLVQVHLQYGYRGVTTSLLTISCSLVLRRISSFSYTSNWQQCLARSVEGGLKRNGQHRSIMMRGVVEESREATGREQRGHWKRAERPLEESREATGREQRGHWKRAERPLEESREGTGREQRGHWKRAERPQEESRETTGREQKGHRKRAERPLEESRKATGREHRGHWKRAERSLEESREATGSAGEREGEVKRMVQEEASRVPRLYCMVMRINAPSLLGNLTSD
ncbi:hypothetical protein J6590_030508 [Homalodisca vitripennis]|nr:hypothetical protein J6590_030508 [Homalodisca vitripennis]